MPLHTCLQITQPANEPEA